MIASVFGELRLRSAAAFSLAVLACATAQTASAADCPGHPDALGTSRTLVVDPRQHPLDRHHAIPQDAAARRPRGGADLRRRAAAEIQQPDSGHPRRPMREGDLLHGRPAGQGQSGRRAQGARCRPHGGHPQPEPSNRHAPAAARALQAGDRRRHRLGDGGTGRRHRARAVLPHSRPARATTASRNLRAPRDFRSGAPIFPPTTGAMFPPRASTISRCSALRPRARASCCCTTSSRARSRRCRKSCANLKARGYRIVHVVPATPERPATPTEPQQWLLHPPSEMVAHLALAENSELCVCAAPQPLPAPAARRFSTGTTAPCSASRSGARAAFRCRGQRCGRRRSTLPRIDAASALPVPAAELFKIPEGLRVTMLANGSDQGSDRRNAAGYRGCRQAAGKPRRHRGRGRGPASGIRDAAARRKRDGTASSQAARQRRPDGTAEASRCRTRRSAQARRPSHQEASLDPRGRSRDARSVRDDLGDAEQDDQREEQQVDIGLHLAGMAQRRRRRRRSACARSPHSAPRPASRASRRASPSSRSMRWKK